MDHSPFPPVDDEIHTSEVDESVFGNVDMPDPSEVSGATESDEEYSDSEGGELFQLAERMLGNVEMEKNGIVNIDSEMSNFDAPTEVSVDTESDNDRSENEDEETFYDSLNGHSEYIINEYSYSTEDTTAYISPDSDNLEESEKVATTVVSNQMQQFYPQEDPRVHTSSEYIHHVTYFQAVSHLVNEEEEVEQENEEEEEQGELNEEKEDLSEREEGELSEKEEGELSDDEEEVGEEEEEPDEEMEADYDNDSDDNEENGMDRDVAHFMMEAFAAEE